MRLIVRADDGTTKEFEFSEGPISIGREGSNQIPLRNKAVSKQHAVIAITIDGKWMVEDLDSTNKTYLNDKAIHKAEIKTGDVLRITDFTMEIDLEESVETESKGQMEDTLTLEAALTTPKH